MNKFIGAEGANVYFGLRFDEPERIGGLKTKYVTPIYPLRDAQIGLATVYHIVESRDLMPPAFFWKRLYDEVMARVGKAGAEIVASWPRWMRDRAFAWRSRPNCSFCFFQRRYEWVGLLEHHPDLYGNAEAIELRAAGDRREEAYTWIDGLPLPMLRERAAAIFEKRVLAVVKLIRAQEQPDLFASALDDMGIAQTSCGLLCGK